MSVWKTADFDLLGAVKMNFHDLWISGMSRKKNPHTIVFGFRLTPKNERERRLVRGKFTVKSQFIKVNWHSLTIRRCWVDDREKSEESEKRKSSRFHGRELWWSQRQRHKLAALINWHGWVTSWLLYQLYRSNNGDTHTHTHRRTGTPVNTPSTSHTFSRIFLHSPLPQTQPTRTKKLFFRKNWLIFYIFLLL